MIAILHNIRSIYNVASIFRTADGLGVEKLYLSGYTPAPIDRFGRSREKFQKVALGAEATVLYETVDDIDTLFSQLKNNGFTILACEPTEGAADFRDTDTLAENACLLFGNEPDGLSQSMLDITDKVIQIPMQGKKSSFNVSVAFGIVTARFIDSKEK